MKKWKKTSLGVMEEAVMMKEFKTESGSEKEKESE